jgi:hypothetical protein
MVEPALLSPYAYLVLSTSLAVAWLILYGSRPDLHRPILRVSLDVSGIDRAFCSSRSWAGSVP